MGAAVELDHNYAQGHALLGMAQMYSGHHRKALESFAVAMRLATLQAMGGEERKDRAARRERYTQQWLEHERRWELETSDGLTLAGWYVPPRNGATVIAFPGRRQPVPHARLLVRHGYGVLLLDPRGQGGSEGDLVRWAGDRDLNAGARYLRSRPDVDPERIGVVKGAPEQVVALSARDHAGLRLAHRNPAGRARWR